MFLTLRLAAGTLRPRQIITLTRSYAKKHKAEAHSTENLVPGSQRVLANDAAMQNYTAASAKMSAAVDWFRKEASKLESRASGRVTPALLTPVRVTLANGQNVGLDEVSTVGVREGSSLLVTVFEESVSNNSILTALSRVSNVFASRT